MTIMLRLIILGLTWLIIVEADNVKVEVVDKIATPETTKIKRFLHHGFGTSTPCPPFQSHFHMPKPPMPLMRPYELPSYPKPVYGPPPPQNQHLQFIQHPVQTYIPKSTLQYMKPQVTIPVYQQQQHHHQQPIVHVQPIIKQQQNYWPISQSYEKPQHGYAPNYQVPMFLPTTQKDWIKPVNYHAAEANRFNNPGIVYKDDAPNCPPCATNQLISHQPLHQYSPPPPQIIHVQSTYAKPSFHQTTVQPAAHYLPAPQSHIVKHHEHIPPCDK